MPNQNQKKNLFTSLSKGSTDSEAVKEYYNDWAKDYDQTLGGWEYRAPTDAAVAAPAAADTDGETVCIPPTNTHLRARAPRRRHRALP